MATISGGAARLRGLPTASEVGSWISRSGLAKRASTCDACAVVGVRARRLVGRLERGSWEVGMDSGIGSDILRETLGSFANKIIFVQWGEQRLKGPFMRMGLASDACVGS